MELKGVKTRLYPNKNQQKQLNQYIGNSRFLWNNFLGKNIRYYNKTEKFKFYYDMCQKLKEFKEIKDFLKLSPSQTLQQTLKDLDQALKNCFNSGFGFPKFKKKDHDESIRFPQGFELKAKSIYLPKLGHVKLSIPTSLKEVNNVKNVTVSKENGTYYVSFCCEFVPKKPRKYKKGKKAVGIDVGTTYLATGSNGKHRPALGELDRVTELNRKIKKTQRKLSKKIKNSNSYIKCKRYLAKLHTKLKNVKRDYIHKFTKMLINNYKRIYVEDLNIKGMIKSSKGTIENHGKNVRQKSGLNRSILENVWGLMFQQLSYKAKWYDRIVKSVNPKNTSQICNKCGYKHKQNRKSQSDFVCGNCGHTENADVNAGKNIKDRGLALTG